MASKRITLIAAMDANNLIGSNNALPWHLPADLKFFKQQTLGKTLLMGRKTCESLPFSLPGRRNLVLSRNQVFQRNGFEIVHDLSDLEQESDLMIIGGAKIYELLLPQATHLIITKIHHSFEGDTHFPTLDYSQWQVKRITNNPLSEDNPNYSFDFVFYQRK